MFKLLLLKMDEIEIHLNKTKHDPTSYQKTNNNKKKTKPEFIILDALHASHALQSLIFSFSLFTQNTALFSATKSH